MRDLYKCTDREAMRREVWAYSRCSIRPPERSFPEPSGEGVPLTPYLYP